MNHKSILFTIILFLCFNMVFSQPKSSGDKLIEAEINTAIVVSLVNKQDGGEWEMESKPQGLNLQERRKGALYNYFIFKTPDLIQGPVTFVYKNGQKPDKKIYFVKTRYAQNKTEENSLSDADREQLKKLVIVSENKKQSSLFPSPENIKIYIDELVEEKLYEKALSELGRIEGDETRNNDKKWLMRKKIEIMEKMKKYDEITSYTGSLLGEDAENKEKDNETDFYLRMSRAKADYYAGKKQEALSQFIFLKNYYPDNPNIYYELGSFYLREKIYSKGVSVFEYMLSKFDDLPMLENIYIQLARYYYQTVGLNGYNLSFEYYQKIVKLGRISKYYKEAVQMVEFLENNFTNIR